MRITPHQEQQGFLTIAQNNADTDYLRLAYLQAMSIKLTMPTEKYAVLVDEQTMKEVTSKHRQVFDYVILIENDVAKNEEWKLSNEWQVGDLTPFKETIKVESDILFTRSISHWWNAFRLRDVVLSTGCKDYQQNAATSRKYRRVFDDNQLPDTYNGLMYFRFTKTALTFFKVARMIFENWDTVSNTLKNCRDPHPTTDVVYALTAKLLGVEQCTLPTADFINFVHMKPAINQWPEKPWHEVVLHELDLPVLRIGNVNQYHPVHYQSKEWVTDDIIKEYENELFR
jgi:hypothetical protein